MSRRPLAVIDSETDPFAKGVIVKPFVWGFYDGESFRHWWEDEEGFVDFLVEQDACVYAHNGGRFDFAFLYRYLDAGDRIKLLHGVPSKIQFGDAELRDSIRILPMALSSFQKTRFDYQKMVVGEREKHRDEIVGYLEDDCRDLFDVLAAYEHEFGRHETVAATAMSQFIKIQGEEIPDRGAAHYERFKPYYFGGRCEVWPGRVGPFARDLASYDINSAYPWACRFDHPCGDPMHGSDLPDSAHRDPYFARIRARSDGALPWRENVGDRINYPRGFGVREYLATGWEIEAGLETGALRIESVKDVYTFSERWNASTYVDEFFERKASAKRLEKEGETAEDRRRGKYQKIFAKFMLNSLYGKSGQDGSRFSDFRLIEPGDMRYWIGEGAKIVGNMGELVVIALPSEHSRFYDVVIAASITGMVRAKLWRALSTSTDPYYCDTDSVFCAEPGSGIEIGDDLGQWELEGEYTHGGFGGRKLYAARFHDASANCYEQACGHSSRFHSRTGAGCSRCDCKGFHDGWKKASKGTRLEPSEIVEIAHGNEVTWEAESPTFSVSRGTFFQKRTIRREQEG